MELQVPKVAPERTSASDGMPYIDFCNSVQDDESGELLKDFRRNPDYDLVLPSMNINEVFGILEKETKTIQTDLRVPTLYWDETKKERNTDATPDADD